MSSWRVDEHGFHCQLKSSFNEKVDGTVCFSVTREKVIKALNRQSFLSSEWILAFLISALHQAPNPNRVFVFPTFFRMLRPEDFTDETKKAAGILINTTKDSKEDKSSSEKIIRSKIVDSKRAGVKGSNIEDRKDEIKKFRHVIAEFLHVVPKSAKGAYDSAAFVVHDREKDDHYRVFHFSWKTYTFDVFDCFCSPADAFEYARFGVSRWEIIELCNALSKAFKDDVLPCLVTNRKEFRGKIVEDNKTKKRKQGVCIQCSTNLFIDPIIWTTCGEVCCMEILSLLDPSLKEKSIWLDMQHH